MPDLTPIRYTLRVPSRRQHTLDVEATVPADASGVAELGMAVWTPGSYLVREYSRHVESVRAYSSEGRELEVQKTRKNRWVVTNIDGASFVLEYRIWCRDLSVRGNWIDDELALLNGAPTFIVPVRCLEGGREPFAIRVEIPEGWSRAISPLPEISEESGGRVRVFRAEDYDTLVDSPIVVGNPIVRSFEAREREHLYVQIGGEDLWDADRAAADFETIVREQHRFWDTVPYRRYVLFNLITEGTGGLEHAESTVLMTSRWKFRTRKTYVDWLGLVSHEFFHTWNVKRLRPVELGPFQYESETYTRSLWVAEGITSYYTDLLVLRAGLSTPGEFLERLSKLFERLYTTPGRLVQSLEDASFDAWIKLYRPDENSVNTTVSYYVKGAIVAFLIDARIRRDTDSARSLDDVLRILWERHSGLAGFMASDITAAIAEIAGADLGDWLEPLLRSTSELDPREALDWFGLRFRPAEERSSDGREKGRAWLGITTRAENGRIVVTQVLRGSPAHDSGIDPLDELVGIGGYRIALEEWESRLDQYEAGDSVDVLVSRRERLLSIPVRLGARPTETWRLEIRPGSTPEEERRRETWWGSV